MQNLLRLGYEKILLLAAVIFRGDYRPTCWWNKRTLKQALATIEYHYIANKEATLSDRIFLEQWLQKLNQYNHYTHKPNSKRIQFLQKHLKKLT